MPTLGKRCAACGKPATKAPNPGFMFLGKDVPLCDGCWSEGKNNEAWNDRIEQRIRDRRAGVKPTWWRVDAEVTISVSANVKAASKEEAEALAENFTVPVLCHECCEAGDGKTEWQLSGELDGEPQRITATKEGAR